MFFAMIVMDSTHPLWIRIMLKGQADRARLMEIKKFRKEINEMKNQNAGESSEDTLGRSALFKKKKLSTDIRGMQIVTDLSELSTNVTAKLEMRATFGLLIIIYAYVVSLIFIGFLIFLVFFPIFIISGAFT